MWGLFGPENQRYGGTGIDANRFSEGTMAMFTQELLQSDCSVIWIWSKNRFCSAVWSHLLHRGERVQNHYVRSRYHTRMTERKKPTENNQSPSIFQLVSFHLVILFLCVCGSWLMTRVWGTTLGDRLDAWAAPEVPQLRKGKEGQIVAPFHLWPLSLWDSARGDAWIRLWMSAELWAYSSELLTDRSSFVTVEGYGGLQPTAVWSIEAVLYGFSPALAPALLCVSCFILCVCVCLSHLSLALWLHFCFDVVWKSPTLCSK